MQEERKILFFDWGRGGMFFRPRFTSYVDICEVKRCTVRTKEPEEVGSCCLDLLPRILPPVKVEAGDIGIVSTQSRPWGPGDRDGRWRNN
jgi:hypothetical protein